MSREHSVQFDGVFVSETQASSYKLLLRKVISAKIS